MCTASVRTPRRPQPSTRPQRGALCQRRDLEDIRHRPPLHHKTLSHFHNITTSLTRNTVFSFTPEASGCRPSLHHHRHNHHHHRHYISGIQHHIFTDAHIRGEICRLVNQTPPNSLWRPLRLTWCHFSPSECQTTTAEAATHQSESPSSFRPPVRIVKTHQAPRFLLACASAGSLAPGHHVSLQLAH